MKTNPRLFVVLFLLLAAGALTGCDKGGAPVTNTRITAANIAKIKPGMNRTQVELLLGPPATSDTKDMIIFKKTTATYTEGKDSVEVIYKNDEVEEVHSTIGGASPSPADTSTSTTTTSTTSN